MKHIFFILLLVSGLAVAACAQLQQFQHIVIVFQENRTPDNLFYALCATEPCSTNPDNHHYNIQTANWLDKTSPSGVTQPTGVALANGYDLDHSHGGWVKECDLNTQVKPPVCRMDGAAGTKSNRGAFVYVLNTPDSKHPNGILSSYLTLATQYGWGNFMFQTNQGPSYPAHQFIFGGTSALSAAGDAAGTFVSENFGTGPAGCYAKDGETTKLINSAGKETTYTINHAAGKTTCVLPQSQGGRSTMANLLDNAGLGWKYYSTKGGGTDFGGSIWTAPNTLQEICVPDPTFQTCTGMEWANHVDLNPSDFLGDALGTGKFGCNLANVSWVIPTGANSDHPGGSKGGPDWVASVVDAVGQSTCTDTINGQSFSYWQDTAIVITWDDFGGWYDHVPPQILNSPEGGYQLGIRVPLIFVSAYTPVGLINNYNHDFGTILRFVERNFGLVQGALGFADQRATNAFAAFYSLSNTPRPFQTVHSAKSALDFINDTTPPTDPDDY